MMATFSAQKNIHLYHLVDLWGRLCTVTSACQTHLLRPCVRCIPSPWLDSWPARPCVRCTVVTGSTAAWVMTVTLLNCPTIWLQPIQSRHQLPCLMNHAPSSISSFSDFRIQPHSYNWPCQGFANKAEDHGERLRWTGFSLRWTQLHHLCQRNFIITSFCTDIWTTIDELCKRLFIFVTWCTGVIYTVTQLFKIAIRVSV